ncbi:hypothetical protein LDENG_00068350 [Lucifuga dentata]|nr:hypothetical protein LDENG_00068350 [Lucifuga dentata]
MPHCQCSLSTLMFLLILQGALVMLFYSWYYQAGPYAPFQFELYPLPPYSSYPSNEKAQVLLLSSWRSGSSFLGQVFGQHPSVFYLMEPGWHVWTKLQKSSARTLRMAVRDLIRSLFQCDFSTMDAYLPFMKEVSALFMWSHSRALCSPPVCSLTPRGSFSNETECFQKCGSQGVQMLEAACSSYSHVVLKEVRFFELESLYPLLQDPKLNLFIIHLVRDPRAVLRSREASANSLIFDDTLVLEQRSIPAAEVQYQVMQEICHSHVNIHETAILKPPPFLKGRYKMVRYEDVVRNPVEEINAMYKFVGLEMTMQLEEWIYRATHGQGKGSKKEAFKTTSRNAMEVSKAWRSTLPFDKIQHIQQVCRPAMSLLRYRPVNSEEEQKSLDLDLLLPQEPYQFSWLPNKTEHSNKTYKNNG